MPNVPCSCPQQSKIENIVWKQTCAGLVMLHPVDGLDSIPLSMSQHNSRFAVYTNHSIRCRHRWSSWATQLDCVPTLYGSYRNISIIFCILNNTANRTVSVRPPIHLGCHQPTVMCSLFCSRQKPNIRSSHQRQADVEHLFPSFVCFLPFFLPFHYDTFRPSPT